MIILLGVIGVIVVIALIIGVWLMGSYNTLVALRQAVKNGWSQIDVQLKRRHDLIPNLVNTVKGYASHEKETFERVVNARARATSATVPADAIKAEGELTAALGRLMAIAEAYPELKANQGFLSLQQELSSTEDRVAFSRQGYNETVTRLNTAVQSFPTVLIAGMFGFKQEPFFETAAEDKEVPKVQF